MGKERNEVTGRWKKLLKEKLHNLYSSPNNNIIIKSRKLKRVRHVGRFWKVDIEQTARGELNLTMLIGGAEEQYAYLKLGYDNLFP